MLRDDRKNNGAGPAQEKTKGPDVRRQLQVLASDCAAGRGAGSPRRIRELPGGLHQRARLRCVLLHMSYTSRRVRELPGGLHQRALYARLGCVKMFMTEFLRTEAPLSCSRSVSLPGARAVSSLPRGVPGNGDAVRKFWSIGQVVRRITRYIFRFDKPLRRVSTSSFGASANVY